MITLLKILIKMTDILGEILEKMENNFLIFLNKTYYIYKK